MSKSSDVHVDWDLEVGHWIKDVPYIWTPPENNSSWRGGQRMYIFGSPQSRGLANKAIRLATGKGRDCEPVKQYFSTGTSIGKDNQIRINGYLVSVPSKYRDQYVYAKYKESFYQYLGVPKPSISSVSDIKIVDVDSRPPHPFIELKLPANPKRKDREILYRTSRHVYLPLASLSAIGKQRGVCTPVIKRPIRDSFDVEQSFTLRIRIIESSFETFSFDLLPHVRQNYEHIIHMCLLDPKVNYILIPLVWQYVFKNEAHQNVLIIDKTRKNIYIFDPWGKTQYDLTKKVMEKTAIQLFNLPIIIGETIRTRTDTDFDTIISSSPLTPESKASGYRVIASEEWCPVVSLQTLEDKTNIRINDYEGFCTVWTYYFISVLLKNPGVEYSKLIRSAIHSVSKISPDFNSFIREYAKKLESIAEGEYKRLGLEWTQQLKQFSEKDRESLDAYISSKRTEFFKKHQNEAIDALKKETEGIKVYYVKIKDNVLFLHTPENKKLLSRALYLVMEKVTHPSFTVEMTALEWSKIKTMFKLVPKTFPHHKLYYTYERKAYRLCGTRTRSMAVILDKFHIGANRLDTCPVIRKYQVPGLTVLFPGLKKK